MPTYQYRCTECGHDLEVVQKFSDSALTECPNCHGVLRKVFNAVGVVFKGSGFYRTDSRGKEGSSSAPAVSGESKKSSDSSSDSKSSQDKKSDTGSSSSGDSSSSSTNGSASSSNSNNGSSTKASTGSSTGSSSAT